MCKTPAEVMLRERSEYSKPKTHGATNIRGIQLLLLANCYDMYSQYAFQLWSVAEPTAQELYSPNTQPVHSNVYHYTDF